MKPALRPLATCLVLSLLALLASAPASAQCVSLTTPGSAVSQNFDTLSNTAGSTTNNLTITGWFMTETGGGARDNEQYAVDTGGSNTGDTYSYGSTAATDRALGGLQSGTLIPLFGACFTNNTGVTISSFQVSYTGEEWRLGTAARTDQINFEYSLDAISLTTGAWTGVAALNFITPVTATTGAKDGNAAANRTALSSTVPALSIANGATFWIRWVDANASGADDGLAVDDFSLTPNPGGPVIPNLSIDDVMVTEGDAGTVTATFTVSLSAPAGAGGVTFDITTADDSATLADNDYVLNSLTGQTIPMGSSTYTFNVTVNGDTNPEANETYFVNVTNVTGANVPAGQGQGLGTINNDDVAITPIHDVQGPGASSPIVGSSVTVRAIVTGVRSNGFFIQEEEADYDADPATSEGILVFVGAAPPAAAVVGALVQVTGTVTEFVPSQDPLQPPLTELTAPTVVQISTGNPLPAPIPLTATFPDPAGVHDQLERLEGMRVSVASLTVSGPTLGSINEANATATSQGVFYGVVTGNARPFREAGIQAPDPPPAGTIPPIPRFDANPERIRVDSDNLTGSVAIDVGAGAVVSNLVGPMDYTFRTYSINPDPPTPPTVAGGPTAVAVTPPTSLEFTVAAYNLQRFFDTVNDPGIGEPVLTATAFDNRLNKASIGIRNFLRFPDIIGVVEIENLTTLQALAARISADAIANSQPDPIYASFLVEGNDVGGIDVGFLVKTATVFGATPRVTVVSVTQEGAATLFVNPDSSSELLNDRPSLVLDAIVNHPNGTSFPIVVIVNHLRSLNGASDPSAGSNGWATVGERVRAKRQQQAEFLANLVQARQVGDPAEHIVLVGDFNAFEVNDGLGDSMGVIDGTPSPDNQTAVPGDGIDLVNPDFDNLFDSPPASDRYSFIFDGNAQSLDHALVNQPLITDTLSHRLEHPRINADFPETARNNAANAIRLADHDPLVAYFEVAAFGGADLAMTKTDGTDPVVAGTNLVYTITATNNGPAVAASASVSDTLPAGTTFVSLASPGGWSCTTPAVGSGGTVSCSNPAFAVGNAVFTLTVAVAPSVAAGTVLSNTATVTSTTPDPSSGNESATATTTVAASADLSITKTDTPDPVTAGNNLTYTVTVTNAGPSFGTTVSMSDTLPAGTTFVSLSSPGGWSCTTPAVGSGGTVTCSIASFAPGSAVFTLVVTVQASVSHGTVLNNTATVSATSPDPNPGNGSATAQTTVSNPGMQVALIKTDTPDPVQTLDPLTYTLTATNSSGQPLDSATLTDPLPADTTFVSLASPAGWSCTTPAVGASGTVTCSTTAGMPAGSAVFTLVVEVGLLAPAGSTISNQAELSASDDGQPILVTAPSSTAVLSPAALAATKSVDGDFQPGGDVNYTVVVTNTSNRVQADNPGPELTDVLPPELALVSASATSGTATATLGTNTVTWNGSLLPGASVTITIVATIAADVAPDTTITNQATLSFDGDGNGTNEASAVSDDISTTAAGDPTGFVVVGMPAIDIPALDTAGLALLALLLAGLGLGLLGRRSRRA
ncbi:MAG TPA: nuclease [Thermoanaerobaculia bacterium]|nr:nuclease [Thermoanaerobaculia bacterium]